jgi:hypothetical protein
MGDLYNLVKIANVSIEPIHIFQFLSMDNLKSEIITEIVFNLIKIIQRLTTISIGIVFLRKKNLLLI